MDVACAVVITTINYPTQAVAEIAKRADGCGAHFIVVGDVKSPADFHQAGAQYYDIDAQLGTGFELAKLAPLRHYARKNVGYLQAIRAGVEVIVETDDDNIPYEGFWLPRHRMVAARAVEGAGWVNVYRHFSDQLIWPRGLPLDEISAPERVLPDACTTIDAPIQQGLADQNPDVDAIYRLVLPLPLDFDAVEPVALGAGAWCPFNSQNTTWWRDAFPLLYLPSYCSFRMTDIWRSFVAQRIAWTNGWSVMFHSSTVYQERNAHSLMQDFAEEVPGYLNNRAMADALTELDLDRGVEAIPANLRRCYQVLVGRGWVGEAELALLDAWLADLERLGRQ